MTAAPACLIQYIMILSNGAIVFTYFSNAMQAEEGSSCKEES